MLKKNNREVKLNESAQNGLRKLYHGISDISFDFRNSNLYSLLTNYLKGVSLLDIGCGPGHFLYSADKNGYDVLGVESDDQLISLGKKLYPTANLRVLNESAEELNLDRKFDNITLIDVLEHIQNDRQILMKLKNNLSHEGHMILVVPAHQLLYGIRDRSIGHYRRYNKHQIIELLKDCGMKPLVVRHWNALGFIPFLISEKLFRKPLKVNIRDHRNQSGIKAIFSKMLNCWFKTIENKYDFRFGLSLVVLAEIKNSRGK